VYQFRLIVRGNNAEGIRVRRVKTIEAATFEQAWADFAEHEAKMSKGLRDVVHAVYPPAGWKVNGELSKGFEVA
jgi:hypothetical protein